MQTAEIITRLRGFAWSMTTAADLAPVAFDAEDAVVINAAIAALDPVPITEAALRAEGFVDVHHGVPLLERPAGVSWIVCDTEGVTFWLRTPRRPDIDLHITTMQQLREVIAAIEGET